ncbi:HEAT repeat-containing protein 3 [Episyrphus balteatus]|uniref:HEAT repeat-containing protein 3 n=1 Tax=Episyrphus balteatus TaxID=286459 RepID=UPI002485CA9B|nr:HEAT repeat-containing protein 3 [Episyrphus balteatus]
MGKTKKNKVRPVKVNPIGIPSLRDLENEDEFNEENSNPIEAIRDQLQSSNIEEKINGLQALAVLSSNKTKVVAICASDVIRIAAPLLVEPNNAVRNACAGALRNLSVCGVDVCENLVEQDVLTPLLALLSEYAKEANWTPEFDEKITGQLGLKSDIFFQSVNLLWNLCESTSVALENFNQSHILESFIRCLDYKVFGFDIAISVAQCLLVISEENPNSWNVFNNHVPEFICLLNIEGDHSHTFLRTLAAGILSNIPALAAAYVNKIFPALSATFDVNHRTVLGEITSTLPLSRQENPTELEVKMDVVDVGEETDEAASLRRRKQDLPTDTEIQVKHVGYLLEAQKVAAEIITNQCATDDDEWIDDNADDASDNESVHDYDNNSKTNSTTNLQNTDKLPVEVLEAIKSFGLVEKLWQKAQPVQDNVNQILRETSFTLLNKVKSLRVSCLLCLQNLCNSMCTEDLGGPTAIYAVWLDLGQQVFQGPQDLILLEPSTSLMRASLEHLKKNSELFAQMSENDLELMLNGVNKCTMPEIRANWLRMLGTLGCLLSERLVKLIIGFILDTCSKEQDVWTISEAIDALMDMFSDNDWNQIVVELNFLERMKALEKVFKSKIRQQKRELNERYPAVLTVRTNLSRFVKYIETEMKKFSSTNGT